MANHPINLGIRFLLELAAWGALGYWGWVRHAGTWRFVLAIGLPLAAMALWGVFRVPNDGGPPVVAVPGVVRLALEAVVFGAAVGLLVDAGQRPLGIGLAIILVAHYAISYDRVARLLTAG